MLLPIARGALKRQNRFLRKLCNFRELFEGFFLTSFHQFARMQLAKTSREWTLLEHAARPMGKTKGGCETSLFYRQTYQPKGEL
jgi:hypothetical protein